MVLRLNGLKEKIRKRGIVKRLVKQEERIKVKYIK